jgi:hypothetical protein
LRLWKWGNDKFDTGYKIFTIAYSMKYHFDCYLFYYPTGSFIPKHKDPDKYGKQYRFNIELVSADDGGKFICKNNIISWFNKIYLFRADRDYHWVTKIEKGQRIVLSFGFFI